MRLGRVLCKWRLLHNCSKLLLHNKFVLSASSWSFYSVKSGLISPPKEIIQIPNDVRLHECIFNELEKHAGQTYLVDGENGASYTFAQARERSLVFASVLSRLGVSKGDVVAILSPNYLEYFPSVFGIIYLGAIVTTVSPSFTQYEIARQLNDSGASVVICHPECYNEFKNAQKSIANLRHLILLGDEQDGALSFHKLMKKDDGKGLPYHNPINPMEDVAFLPYSSGTTGLPKGVMLTHYNLVSNIHQSSYPQVFHYSRGDIFIANLPFYHLYGLFKYLCLFSFIGMKGIIMRKYATTSYVDLILKYKATLLETVPPIVSSLCYDPYATAERLASVHSILCAAAPFGFTLYDKFQEKYGHSIWLCEGYGMTELSPVALHRRKGNTVIGSCGTPIPNTHLKIIDPETGMLFGPEKNGELCVKGPQVMKGYWNNPEASRSTIGKDGWLRTGDIARMDEEGNFFIIDRLKELIKVKGLQVAPAELEDLLRTHPKVKDVAVVGIADERSGELPMAYVVSSEEDLKTSEELIKFVEGKVAPYKQLKGGVTFIKEIPKSPSGKILRRHLRNQNT